MKKTLVLLLACASSAAFAQDTTGFRVSGRLSAIPQQTDNNTNSSKLSEYRDLEDIKVPLFFDVQGKHGARYFMGAAGKNITKKDQSLTLSSGRWGVWHVDLGWSELPHNLSNKAMTPYSSDGKGLLDASTAVPITFKQLATSTAAHAISVQQMDTLIANYARANARPVDLGTQTKVGSAALRFTGVQGLDLSVGYDRRAKNGNKVGYGPIGDRPPRTLNVELPEPVDYLTNNIAAAAEYDRGRYQLRAEYEVSQFENGVDNLRWRNLYATPTAAGGTTATWDRLVSVYGQRALAPDNKYQNTTLQGGVNLPFESRVTVTAGLGEMTQNTALLPYTYGTGFVTPPLPRSTAEGKINTKNYAAELTSKPLKAVDVRAFYRLYDLEDETPAAQWWYVTQDVANTSGTSTFQNKRVSLASEFKRRNIGMDGTYRIPFWKSAIGLGYEHEQMDREHRESSNWENTWRASWRMQPANWLSLRTRYATADRDGMYNGNVTKAGYWYSPADVGTDNNNPQFAFVDHPDLRRFDVAKRQRNQLDVVAGLTPRGSRLSMSASFTMRNDDYDSDVTPSQPLKGRLLADSLATTPGDQLGLLTHEQKQFGIDASYLFSDRLTVTGSVGMDIGSSTQRGLEFNENNKQNPSAIATAELGPWTRKTNQWTADNDDKTRYGTLGGSFAITPKVNLDANYTLSRSTFDVIYSGYGVTNWDGTPFTANQQFSFRTPPSVKQDFQTADVQLDVAVRPNVSLRVGYVFDTYGINDWQQEASTAQYEPVITELLLRDTSRSYQWGNRYLNMGPMLAPKYTANIVQLGVIYTF